MPCISAYVYLQQEVLDSTTMEPTKRITEEWFEIKRCDGQCCFVDRDPVIVPKEETPEAALPPSPGKAQREGTPLAEMLEDVIPIDAAPGTTMTDSVAAAPLKRIEAAQIKATAAAESATGEGQGGIILERLQRVEALLENLLQRIG
ncbi:hypothetical protein EXIGLDRAFT_770183 [Exidia glandulosa HHB12029]|uniref:Uncharacterized protein n=1 Tax=Exidia glandulosa HHB12029 TaxID=1314781 RepID=A0A165GX16_EXIGL|nr:hypothetical protein EXIGLDRAFT_770183 [Exidia glandulosa HHB12029]